MTVTATDRRSPTYLGNDSATTFSFAFKVFSKTDIAVYVTNTAGAVSLAVLDSAYSVVLNADQKVSPGGAITYPISGAPLATGASLVILGAMPYTQPLALPGGGNFNPVTMEQQLDRDVIYSQQLAALINTTMRGVPGELVNPLPNAAARANRVQAYDSAGNPIVIPGVDSSSAAALAIDLASTAAGKGGTLIGWLRALTGAVATTVKEWLGWQDVSLFEFLTVAQIADYQAGTRTLDLTVPMQAWATACAGRRGILPKGAAKITSAIVLPNAIEIVGQGWGTSLNAYNCSAFVIPAGGAFFQLRGLILVSRDGAGVIDPRTQKAIDFQGQFANRCNFVTLDTLYLQGWNIAINQEYTWYTSINNVYTINTNTSLRQLGQCVNTSVTNSYLIANGGNRSAELTVDAGHRGEGLVFSNCLLASGGNAIYSTGFLDLALYGCTVDLITNIAFDLTGVDNFIFDGPWVYSAARCFDINDVGSPVDSGTSIKVGRATVTGNDDVIYIGSGNKGVVVHDSGLYKVAGVGYPIEVQGVEAIISNVHITNTGSATAEVFVNAAGVAISNLTGDKRISWNVSPVPTVASVAGALTIPPTESDAVVLSGALTITSIVATGWDGRTLTLISTGGTWALTDGSNLKLNGSFTATADDAITLVCNGTNWYEVSRSAN